MQSGYAESFAREMGCTEADWLRWLPAAIGDREWARLGSAAAQVRIGAGLLTLEWHELEERAIALVRLPRLQVRFAFEGVQEEERFAFMKRFDLYMQRGGG